jgi:hypothetical protein
MNSDAESLHAAARVRRRLKDWLAKEGNGSKPRLARTVDATSEPKSSSGVLDITRTSRGTRDIRLRDLDDIAEAMGVPVGELVQPDGTDFIEVKPAEMRLIRHLRSMPDSAQQHWLARLDHMACTEAIDAKDNSRQEPSFGQEHGGDAFPTAQETSAGMTLRDHFAVHALAGMCASRGSAGSDADAFAQWAYKCADAMLRARVKSHTGQLRTVISSSPLSSTPIAAHALPR